MAKPTKQGKGAGSKPKEGCKSQAQKAKKRGFQSRKRHASDGSDNDAVSSDPEGPSSRPKKKGKHVTLATRRMRKRLMMPKMRLNSLKVISPNLNLNQ
jgi:hypothetical protein